MELLTIYTEEELGKIQVLETDALKIIIEICEKLEIEYFLIGGTALGAIRHNGFIPWDDDIDVGMTRSNYERFLKDAPQYLPDGYFLQTPYEGTSCPYFYSKLRIDNTKFVEYCNHRVKMHHGVYVDIFPFDEVPDDENLNREQFNRVQKLIRLFTLRQSPDVSMEPSSFKERMKAQVRRMAHCFMMLYPYKRILHQLEAEFTRYNGSGQKAYACLNFPKIYTEYVLKSDLYPLKKHKFGEVEAFIPNNYDVYLRTHYGDYMKLPPEEQRFGHKPYIVVLDKE